MNFKKFQNAGFLALMLLALSAVILAGCSDNVSQGNANTNESTSDVSSAKSPAPVDSASAAGNPRTGDSVTIANATNASKATSGSTGQATATQNFVPEVPDDLITDNPDTGTITDLPK